MNHVYNAIDRLIEHAISYRNTLGSGRLGVQADITEAAGVAAEWVGECRHNDEMSECVAREREEERQAIQPESVTCPKCELLRCLSDAERALANIPLAQDRAAQVQLDLAYSTIVAQIDAHVHFEASGCNHAERDNFPSIDSDDGPDSEY